MRWRPRLQLLQMGTVIGGESPADAMANGFVLQLAWLGLVVEIALAIEQRR